MTSEAFNADEITRILTYEVTRTTQPNIATAIEVARTLGKTVGIDIPDTDTLNNAIQNGSKRGTNWAMKQLPTVEVSRTVTFTAHPFDVTDALDEQFGQHQTVQFEPHGPQSHLYGRLVMSGARNMNPALVFAVQPNPDTSSIVQFSGHAKEGWIKQHTAEKAIGRCIEELNEALRDPTS